MTAQFALLKYVGKLGLRCILNAAGGGVIPFGDFVVDGLEEVWGEWRYDRDEQQRRAEIQAVAQTTAEELRREIPAIVQEIAADRSKEVQESLTLYLNQVPGTIRRSLRRPSDPTGTTVPPHLAPKKAEDLLPFLPTRISPYKTGDYPLASVDLQLEELLGSGGFGEVWKARNPDYSNRPPVALKFCLDQSSETMLKNEMATLNRVRAQGQHPGIVQLNQTYLRAEHPCLEYEYIGGGDLAGLIKEERDSSGGIDPARAEEMIRELAEIVSFAHQLNPPIVHRDLKPANILLKKDETGKIAFKITDFGLGGIAAKQAIYQASRKTSHQQIRNTAILGAYTPLYASKQQMYGGEPDPRDDVYALGVIWYQLLTGDLTNGCPTGKGWKKRLAVRGMPDSRIELMERCFEEDPEERFSNAAELVKEFQSSTQITVEEKTAKQDASAILPKPVIKDVVKEKIETPRIKIPPPKKIEEPPKSLLIELPNMPKDAKPLELVLIPAGKFMMGSPENEKDRSFDEGPQHHVTISKPFYMGKYEITQEQWQAVMGNNPSHFKGKNLPVEEVSWNNCQAFLEKLNKMGKGSFRLPTEAEWEYACRAGTTTRVYWGDDPDYKQIDQYAWYTENSGSKTHEVGTKKPNAWGLFDMSGNVWEWCQDWYGNYSSESQINPTGVNNGSYRVLRGGGWYSIAGRCRSAFRYWYGPGNMGDSIGFRVVCVRT